MSEPASATTTLHALPAASRHSEAWANGTGSTTLLLREPDNESWRIRASIAQVEHDGPFSELPNTRRLLVPLDAAMELLFPQGRVLHTNRFGVLNFEGAPAPSGTLPEGPTRDFNLMLRGDARGELFARTLVDSMVLPPEPGTRWLVYLNRGYATLNAGEATLALEPDDATLLIFPAGIPGERAVIEGAGELVLAKLYPDLAIFHDRRSMF